MNPPSFAPLYASLYPRLANIANSYGYALTIHGSLNRDFDLVMIPWMPVCGDHIDALRKMAEELGWELHEKPQLKPHGRLMYAIAEPGVKDWKPGVPYIDVSVVPFHKPLVVSDQKV